MPEPPLDSEKDLLVEMVDPDAEYTALERSFREVYQRLHDTAMWYAERVLQYADAEDVVQAAANAVWGRWRKLRPEQRTDAYFMEAVHNRIHNAVTRARNDEVELDEESEELVAPVDPPIDPETNEVDEVALFRSFVRGMTPRRREVWIHVVERHLSYEETAQLLGLSYSTIGRHIAMARDYMLKEMSRHGIRLSAGTIRLMLSAGTQGDAND